MKKFVVVVAAGAVLLVMAGAAYALDLETLKINFLKGDYKAAINEGERVLAGANKHSSKLDELYYYLGVSYLKDGNILRAGDIFDIIIKECKKSAFSEQAAIGLIDCAIAQKDYKTAVSKSQAFLAKYPKSKFRLEVKERMKQSEAKVQPAAGTETAHADQLQKLIGEAVQGNQPEQPWQQPYFIQVGAFSSKVNARKLGDKLEAKGYTVYIAEAMVNGKSLFKVRVGSYATREEAQEQEALLKKQGYPTKVLP